MRHEARARRFFRTTQKILEDKNARIKSLQQHIRRIQDRKVETLCEDVNENS
jgi:hypothetical protein